MSSNECRPVAGRMQCLMGRRETLVTAARGLGALAVLSALPWQAKAAQLAVDDPRICASRVALDAGWGKLGGYIARPATGSGPFPGVIVLHDKRGLTPHFEDVARRLAVEGFVALAPDYASRFGGTPSEAGPAEEVVGMATWDDMIADTRTALSWLGSGGGGSGKIGAVGFGLGGTAVGHAVPKLPGLKAAVTFYGRPPSAEEITGAKVPLLIHLARRDPLVEPQVSAFEEALKTAHVTYELFTYDNTERGFDDDSGPHYAAAAAELAWSRTVAFLKERLA